MWAGNGRISTDPIEGGIQITAEQYQEALAGLADGKVVSIVDGVLHVDFPPPEPAPPAEPAPPPTYGDYVAAVDAFVDAVARSRGFSDGASAASWVGSSVLKWAADAVAFVAWRDQVWLQVFADLEPILADEIDRPPTHDFVNALPGISWPGAD